MGGDSIRAAIGAACPRPGPPGGTRLASGLAAHITRSRGVSRWLPADARRRSARDSRKYLYHIVQHLRARPCAQAASRCVRTCKPSCPFDPANTMQHHAMQDADAPGLRCSNQSAGKKDPTRERITRIQTQLSLPRHRLLQLKVEPVYGCGERALNTAAVCTYARVCATEHERDASACPSAMPRYRLTDSGAEPVSIGTARVYILVAALLCGKFFQRSALPPTFTGVFQSVSTSCSGEAVILRL